MLLRLIRIAAIATALTVGFAKSQAATLARSGETVPGARWALAAVSLIFLVSAVVTERTRRDTPNLQKDLLWGLGCGGIAAAIAVG